MGNIVYKLDNNFIELDNGKWIVYIDNKKVLVTTILLEAMKKFNKEVLKNGRNY